MGSGEKRDGGGLLPLQSGTCPQAGVVVARAGASHLDSKVKSPCQNPVRKMEDLMGEMVFCRKDTP